MEWIWAGRAIADVVVNSPPWPFGRLSGMPWTKSFSSGWRVSWPRRPQWHPEFHPILGFSHLWRMSLLQRPLSPHSGWGRGQLTTLTSWEIVRHAMNHQLLQGAVSVLLRDSSTSSRTLPILVVSPLLKGKSVAEVTFVALLPRSWSTHDLDLLWVCQACHEPQAVAVAGGYLDQGILNDIANFIQF